MKQKVMALLLAWAMTVTLGCGLIDALFGSGNAQRPATMWSDVPQMEGMTQENLDLPLPLRLILQGLVQSAGAGEGIRVDNFQLLAFTSSSKSPADVKAFYTLERMRSAGWDSPEQIGCIEGTDQTTSNDVFCLFSKGATGSSGSLLVVIGTQEQNQATTNIYFVRFDGALSPTPGSN
jgi:hypothetical protein